MSKPVSVINLANKPTAATNQTNKTVTAENPTTKTVSATNLTNKQANINKATIKKYENSLVSIIEPKRKIKPEPKVKKNSTDNDQNGKVRFKRIYFFFN